MKVCLSQFRSSANVETNVKRHVEVIRRAASTHCDFVLFPELSLTGYEPSRARALALQVEDPCLIPLREASRALGVTVACGAPLVAGKDVEIGLLIFEPDQAPSTYAKQRLHEDENAFFVPGQRHVQVRLGGDSIAPGICFESLQPSHIGSAVYSGATVYAASVAKPAARMPGAHEHYAAMAAKHGIPVLLANAVGRNGEFVSGGRSAAWSSDGSRLACLEDEEPGELVVEL